VIHLAFKTYNHKIKTQQGIDYIFCIIRKKWLLLTPEEWVRQNILWYCIELGYPKTMIAVEKQIKLQDVVKRFDIVVYKNEQVWMLIECKEMNTQITEAVLQQILLYNTVLTSNFLVITNGNNTLAWQLQPIVKTLTTLPNYQP
jgi:hypothetical protein